MLGFCPIQGLHLLCFKSGLGPFLPDMIPNGSNDISDYNDQEPDEFVRVAFEMTVVTKKQINQLEYPEDEYD